MKIGVVKKELVQQVLPKNKFSQPKDLLDVISWINKSMIYHDRKKVETDTRFLQPIPYVVLRNKDYILTYKRTKNSGEKRLHDFYSIGLGGHIDEGETIEEALVRELKEEIGYNVPIENGKLSDTMLTPIGLLYDNSTPVSSVHLGIIYLYTVPGLNIETNKELTDASFTHISQIPKLNLENWSRVLTNVVEVIKWL